MSRNPPQVWAAVQAARHSLDEGITRPVVDEATASTVPLAVAPSPCPSCSGYGWTVAIDGATPYLNRVISCPDCQPEDAA